MNNDSTSDGNTVIVIYDKSCNVQFVEQLIQALNKLNFFVLTKHEIGASNIKQAAESIRSSEAKFAVSLVEGRNSFLLRMPANVYDNLGKTAGDGMEAIASVLEESQDISADQIVFSRALFKLSDDAESNNRPTLILPLSHATTGGEPVSASQLSDPNNRLSTRKDRKVVRISRSDWAPGQSTDLEASFSIVLKLFLNPKSESNVTSRLTKEDLCKTLTGIEEPCDLLKELADEVYQSLTDEIGLARHTLERFFDCLFSHTEFNPINPSQRSLFILHALASMNMARRLASLNLEGEKFNCLIVFVNEDKNTDSRLESSGSIKFLQLGEKVQFSTAYESKLRGIVELGISECMFFVVDWKTNNLLSVWGRPDHADIEAFFNSQTLKQDASNKTIKYGIHVRPDERVDFYNRSGKRDLIWDGFQWKTDEVRRLDEVLKSLSMDDDIRDTITRSVGNLLDGGYSSIFVFVNENDPWDTITNKSLRSDLLLPNYVKLPIPLSNLTPGQLANFLKLDGAHFLCNDRLLSICRNLTSPEEYWHTLNVQGFGAESLSNLQNIYDTDFYKKISIIDHGESNGEELIIKIDVKSQLEIVINHMKTVPNCGERNIIDVQILKSLGLFRATTQEIGSGNFAIQGKDGNLNCERVHGSHIFDGDENYCLLLHIHVPGTLQRFDNPINGLYTRIHTEHQQPSGFDVFVDLSAINEIQGWLSKGEWEHSSRVMDVLDQWLIHGRISGVGNSGTGTRAAQSASTKLKHSLVVKISASGKMFMFKHGQAV
jgi:hypothetical protein